MPREQLQGPPSWIPTLKPCVRGFWCSRSPDRSSMRNSISRDTKYASSFLELSDTKEREMEETPVTLPIDHPAPLDPPEGLDELRARGPLTPMTFPDGHVGWLVTGYDAVCALLTDSRLSSRRDLVRMPLDIGFETSPGVPAEPGNFLRMDPPEHTRYRRL